MVCVQRASGSGVVAKFLNTEAWTFSARGACIYAGSCVLVFVHMHEDPCSVMFVCVRVFVRASVCGVSVRPSVCWRFGLSIYLSVCVSLSIYLSVCLSSICLYLSIYLSIPLSGDIRSVGKSGDIRSLSPICSKVGHYAITGGRASLTHDRIGFWMEKKICSTREGMELYHPRVGEIVENQLNSTRPREKRTADAENASPH